MKLPVSPPDYDRYIEQQRSGVIERSFADFEARAFGVRWEDEKTPFYPATIAGVCDAVTQSFDPLGWLYPSTGSTVYGGVATFQLNHSYHEGKEIRAHVHWEKTADGTGHPEWILQYKWHRLGEARGADWTTLTEHDPANETPLSDLADVQMLTPFTPISAEGINISDLLICRLLRDPSATNDSYSAGDVRMLMFDLHVPMDDRGSYKVHSKR